MLLRTRLILLGVCVFLFVILVPYLVLYSMGYRVDFGDQKITKTGGIYVKAMPLGASIGIDSMSPKTTNIFSSSVFVQNLLPKFHTISIKKDGYVDYEKTLPVAGNQVTKLENVILFKKDLRFDVLSNDATWFSLSPDGSRALVGPLLATTTERVMGMELVDLSNGQKSAFLLPTSGLIKDAIWSNTSDKLIVKVNNSYFLVEPTEPQAKVTVLPTLLTAKQISFASISTNQTTNLSTPTEKILFIKNKNLYAGGQELPLVQDVYAYQAADQKITWLAGDGFIYASDGTNAIKERFNTIVFPLKKTSSYTVTLSAGNVFLQENASLYMLDRTSKAFGLIAQNVTNFKTSPDGLQLLYASGTQLWNVDISGNVFKKSHLQTALQPINTIWWMNNYYVAFRAGDSISMCETDDRGPVNTALLPNTITVVDGNIRITNPLVSFNQRDAKFYLLTQQTMVASERIIP